MKKPLVILAGPTATGKTELSISLAKIIDGEIISADSMQVYKGLDIGTAKIREEEMRCVPHFLIDEINPGEEFNVFMFKSLADSYIDQITSRGHIPIIVGGTGFYIQAVLYDVDFVTQSGDNNFRSYLEAIAKDQGPDVLFSMLEEIDPDAAREIHKNNIKRVIRALEFYHGTGVKISEHNKEQRKNNSPYNFAYFVLNRDRKDIYNRVNARVDAMIEEGLIEEVRKLLESGVPEKSPSMQGLGYKEIVSYLKGECTPDEAKEKIKLNTRHFAKRQITWFKREKDAVWINIDEGSIEDNIKKITCVLKQKEIIC